MDLFCSPLDLLYLCRRGKQLGGLSLAPKRSMRKVRATESIPLVNVQGVGDGRENAEENNRLVQAR